MAFCSNLGRGKRGEGFNKRSSGKCSKKGILQLRLDISMYGCFDKCTIANEFLTKKKKIFLKFYERRDKCRYLIKKEACGDNKIMRDIFFSVTETFKSYEVMKRGLRNKEKEDFCSINIICKPVSNNDDLVLCYFTDSIHLGFRSYIS